MLCIRCLNTCILSVVLVVKNRQCFSGVNNAGTIESVRSELTSCEPLLVIFFDFNRVCVFRVFRFAPETCRDRVGLFALDPGALYSLFPPCFRFVYMQWALPIVFQLGRRVTGALCQPLSAFVPHNATELAPLTVG